MKKALCIILVFVLSLGFCSFAYAISVENLVADAVLGAITKPFEEYYSISNATARVVGIQSDGQTASYTIDVLFSRTLKAEKAEDLPSIQGMIDAKESISDTNLRNEVESYITSRIVDLNENYIGVSQDTSATLLIALPSIMLDPLLRSVPSISIDDIMFEDEWSDSIISAVHILPPSADQQYSAGEELVREYLTSRKDYCEKSGSFRNMPPTDNLTIMSYNRVTARNYARTWSCSLGITGAHSSCWNSLNYLYLDTDCANFVSQCMHEGGLPTDSDWYPYSSYWSTTGNYGNGLRNYVSDNHLFFHTTNISKAFAGSIINKLNSDGSNVGHVGLIDQNDTITVTFCAHDTCQHSAVVSDWSYKDYYVPFWDSYGSQWVS